MAEEIAREIIAQSRGGSKLAFSFDGGRALLFTSRDANEKIHYHVEARGDATEQSNEFKYSDLKGAVALLNALLASFNPVVKIVLYEGGFDCKELASLNYGTVVATNLIGLINEKINIIDAEVINVTAL